MRVLAGLLVLLSLLGGFALESAAAISPVLYLVGDSVPSASMSPSPPSGQSLPNFDPGRDEIPGLLVSKGSGSVGENDSTKYQQWSYPVGGETLSVEELVIWAAPKDFNDDKTVIFNVYVLSCAVGCEVLDSASATVTGGGWSLETIGLDVSNHTFAAGRQLRVKIVVDNKSDDDMWFAYGTASYPAHLSVSALTPTTSTTSTTVTSVTSVTSSTNAPSTSTSTTLPSVSPTTAPPGPGVSSTTTVTQVEGDAAATTTTTPTASAGANPRPPTPDPPTGPGGPGSTVMDLSGQAGPIPVAALPAVVDSGVMTRAAEEARALEPEEGLMVAFSTAVEAIRMHWMAALTLGTLAAVLLLVGSRRDQEDESLATTGHLPHQLYERPGWYSNPDN
jgi:hypothetical protein